MKTAVLGEVDDQGVTYYRKLLDLAAHYRAEGLSALQSKKPRAKWSALSATSGKTSSSAARSATSTI